MILDALLSVDEEGHVKILEIFFSRFQGLQETL